MTGRTREMGTRSVSAPENVDNPRERGVGTFSAGHSPSEISEAEFARFLVSYLLLVGEFGIPASVGFVVEATVSAENVVELFDSRCVCEIASSPHDQKIGAAIAAVCFWHFHRRRYISKGKLLNRISWVPSSGIDQDGW
jgi:hypothetical protein